MKLIDLLRRRRPQPEQGTAQRRPRRRRLPPLLSDARRWQFAALVGTGALQAGTATVSAGLVGAAITANALSPLLLGGLLGSALLTGAAGLAERYFGERLAQSYVLRLREKLFAAAIPTLGQVEESRLLMPFVGDLTAVRNWAARGPAALLTATVAALATSLLLLAQHPQLATGLLPLLAATALLLWLARLLAGRITEQRRVRGQLTRFVMRRLRVPSDEELATRRRVRRADKRRLAWRAQLASDIAIRRATVVGVMDAVALAGGGLGIFVLLAIAGTARDESLIAGLALIGFIASRLVEVSRALHACVGGKVALEQIETRLRYQAQIKAGLTPPAQDISSD
ncbi:MULTISPECIES: hypothetical protein [unclassified Novosphingobium]|uniref:hypothetical protein n=1 Tax=unclassified Novosphingobium TaxID=2644732 RepID=UPI0025EBAAF2|nr:MULTISPECIES: hypothetical protein [unclassified Novosphingobium]HQS68067.1 hypothetical protein [Novosphingobium sp.]